MTRLELFRIKSMWGNYYFDYACSLSRGRPGGKWTHFNDTYYMINVYGPQNSEAKAQLWYSLHIFMHDHNEYVSDSILDAHVTALDRLWSDHNPVIFHVSKVDYGPIPFNFFTLGYIEMIWMRKQEISTLLKEIEIKLNAGMASEENKVTRVNLIHEFNELEKFSEIDVLKKSRVKWAPRMMKTQRDPLSPFLFIIVMEGLHLAINEAVQTNLIHGPVVGAAKFNGYHFFFADDVVIVTEWTNHDMDNLKRVLHVFHLASGLKINMHKSNVFGVGVLTEDVIAMARRTCCEAGSFPFKYLGVQIGSNMNRVDSWSYLVSKFNDKLSNWKANLPSIGGRLTLIKVVLSSVGIYHMSIFKLPETTIRTLEHIRASFFWGGGEDRKKRQYLGVSNNNSLSLLLNDLHGFQLGSGLDFWQWNLDVDDCFTVSGARHHLDEYFLPSLSSSTRWYKFLPHKVNIFL
ncbi:putative RNA-directed DNA polymerase, eukaryota, reverse transcriptase zinc-binding domain protein [Tanacetum coccineum]